MEKFPEVPTGQYCFIWSVCTVDLSPYATINTSVPPAAQPPSPQPLNMTGSST